MSEEDATEKVEPKVPRKVPQENLLGEVDEEDVRAIRNRVSQPVKPRYHDDDTTLMMSQY